MRLASQTFGRRLKAIRRDRGFTQAELAALIGRSKQSVSAWENSVCDVRLIAVEKCAAALECKVKDLLAPLDKPCRAARRHGFGCSSDYSSK